MSTSKVNGRRRDPRRTWRIVVWFQRANFQQAKGHAINGTEMQRTETARIPQLVASLGQTHTGEPLDQNILASTSPVRTLPDARHSLICRQPTQLVNLLLHLVQLLCIGCTGCILLELPLLLEQNVETPDQRPRRVRLAATTCVVLFY